MRQTYMPNKRFSHKAVEMKPIIVKVEQQRIRLITNSC